MESTTKEDFLLNADNYISRIKEGALFIYPTDTIYGIGCIATDAQAVGKIRALKERNKNPFSVIVPSKEWILRNCIVPENAGEWILKLPGPFTLIFTLKKKRTIAENVNNTGTLGVRIPDHWVMQVLKKLDAPVVTTSVNIAGQEFMTSLDDLNAKFQNNVDFIVYEGEKKGRPSTVVDLSGSREKIVRR